MTDAYNHFFFIAIITEYVKLFSGPMGWKANALCDKWTPTGFLFL